MNINLYLPSFAPKTSIIELVAIGARTSERHLHELQNIQQSSALITSEIHLDELLRVIVERTAAAFAAPVSLMLPNPEETALRIGESQDLSEGYITQRRIPKDEAMKLIQGDTELSPIIEIDYRTRDPFGQYELVK